MSQKVLYYENSEKAFVHAMVKRNVATHSTTYTLSYHKNSRSLTIWKTCLYKKFTLRCFVSKIVPYGKNCSGSQGADEVMYKCKHDRTNAEKHLYSARHRCNSWL